MALPTSPPRATSASHPIAPTHAAIPRTDLWPVAIRSAELHRGTLVRCGPGTRPVGWPETPRVRAHALAPWLTEQRIAVQRVAAWIWGAARDPGTPLHFAMRGSRRAFRTASRIVELHEFQFVPGDLVPLDQALVTSPLRTVFDLLRSPADFTRTDHVACRLLLGRAPDGAERLHERLRSAGRPFRAQALARLERCAG